MEILYGIGILIVIYYIWAYTKEHDFNGKDFRLENSRQFVMSFSTAYSHGIQVESKGYVSMEYYDKRYMYKIIRTIERSYYYRGQRQYLYVVLEKVTDEQPPNYSSMKRMKAKEEGN